MTRSADKRPTQPSGARQRAFRAVGVHSMRIAVFVGVILLLRAIHDQVHPVGEHRSLRGNMDAVRDLLEQADRLAEKQTPRGERIVLDREGKQIGTVIQSAPESDGVAGFSGPTNVAIAFDETMRVVGMKVVTSGDTREHVGDIKRDPHFLDCLNGLTWEEAVERASTVDGVSGATLTSLAILEGVIRRLERQPKRGEPTAARTRSLRFPAKINLSDAKSGFPDAAAIRVRSGYPCVVDVLNGQGKRIGGLIRTAPMGDSIIGYQGPTDAIVLLDENDRVIRVRIRSSFENEPYIGYVVDDEYFAKRFTGWTLSSLADVDLAKEEVEGVSGATMTSLAIAESLPLAAAEAIRIADRPSPASDARSRSRPIVVALRDVGTLVILLVACVAATTRLGGVVWLRRLFQGVLIAYLGFLNGDLLSQAQLIGWASHGVPWQFAPGLVVLTAASLLAPIFTKRQIYCQRICPFGAAQQLIRPRQAPSWAKRLRPLRAMPALLAAFCLLVGYSHWPIELASLEPFDAFLFGSLASIVIAIIGLITATRVPMAYCRYGCPTGAVLGYIRFRPSADRLDWRDAGAVALLLFGAALFLSSRAPMA